MQIRIIILIWLVCNAVYCEDPFAKGKVPSSITTVSWGSMQADRSKFIGQVISICGCISARVKNEKIYLRVFRDRESFLLNRPLEYISISDADSFCAKLDKNDFDKWKLLDGRDVEIWGEFEIPKGDLENEVLGNLKAPYLLRVYLSGGVEVVFQDEQAKWK